MYLYIKNQIKSKEAKVATKVEMDSRAHTDRN